MNQVREFTVVIEQEEDGINVASFQNFRDATLRQEL
jgi:hypothetical protein